MNYILESINNSGIYLTPLEIDLLRINDINNYKSLESFIRNSKLKSIYHEEEISSFTQKPFINLKKELLNRYLSGIKYTSIKISPFNKIHLLGISDNDLKSIKEKNALNDLQVKKFKMSLEEIKDKYFLSDFSSYLNPLEVKKHLNDLTTIFKQNKSVLLTLSPYDYIDPFSSEINFNYERLKRNLDYLEKKKKEVTITSLINKNLSDFLNEYEKSKRKEILTTYLKTLLTFLKQYENSGLIKALGLIENSLDNNIPFNTLVEVMKELDLNDLNNIFILDYPLEEEKLEEELKIMFQIDRLLPNLIKGIGINLKVSSNLTPYKLKELVKRLKELEDLDFSIYFTYFSYLNDPYIVIRTMDENKRLKKDLIFNINKYLEISRLNIKGINYVIKTDFFDPNLIKAKEKIEEEGNHLVSSSLNSLYEGSFFS